MYEDSKYIVDKMFKKPFSVESASMFDKTYFDDFHSRIMNVDVITKEQYKVDGRNKIIQFDRPDLALLLNKRVYVIEHFNIDASKRHRRKGSAFKSKYTKKYYDAITERATKELIEGNDHSLISEKTCTRMKYEYLFENLTDSFEDHYNKLDQYKKNITDTFDFKFEEIHYLFFVHVDVIFPSFRIGETGNMEPFTPSNDKRYYTFLKKHADIDGIILHYSSPSSGDRNIFLRVSEDNIDYYLSEGTNIFDISKIEVFDFEAPVQSTLTTLIQHDK